MSERTVESVAREFEKVWMASEQGYFPEFVARYVLRCERAALEQAAMLHESINVACDHERERGDPGAGAMGAVIEYRDAIRRLAAEIDTGEHEGEGTT